VALNLDNNGFVGTLPSELGKLTALTSFSLAGNTFKGVVPAGIPASLTYW
jgi:hypothetical protein